MKPAIPVNPAHLSILVIDDDPFAIDFVREALAGRPVTVTGASDAESGLAEVRQGKPGLVLQDLVLPGANGTDLIEKIRNESPECHLIIVTGHYSTESAVKAIHAGADDYLNKPVSLEVLRQRVDSLLAAQVERQKAAAIERELLISSTFEGIVGRAIPMLDLLTKVRRIAPHFSTALVTGETGTGKELVSRALHAWSGRPGPFIVCNCASIVPTLFDSELFGHRKGSFTGATSDRIGLVDSANRGTIFLDEMGEVPLESQAKLLRLLQNRETRRVGDSKSREIDVRVVAATNRDLHEMVSEGKFREDLYYRLSMVQFRVPGLREHRDDLPLLIRHFLEGFSERYSKPNLRLTKRAEALIHRHSWPGNIRELENALSYACMLTQSATVDIGDLPQYLTANQPTEGTHLPTLANVEYDYAMKVLKECNGNRARASDVLGIGRATLYRLLSRKKVS
ncbi:MAG TPA: sigma-54 dependent transcriptional regulator [Bryobacteraceae bacterium]|nr:sigma-54 dependent transcriptional regulator [Bryobacteraceae bacterium]